MAALTTISTSIAEVKTRLTAIEKVLKEME
jgi:hypothetical protein